MYIKNWLLLIIFISIFIACGEDQEESAEAFAENLPQVHPEEITSFDSAGDTLLFDNVGSKSIPVEGGFVLYDSGQDLLLRFDNEGEFMEQGAGSGRGPGELNSIISITKNGNDEIVLYDQGHKKVVRYNSELEYQQEFTPQPYEDKNISAVYPTNEDNRFLSLQSSFDYIRDKSIDPQKYLIPFNSESGSYGEPVAIKTGDVARVPIRGQLRGARPVPYSAQHLLTYNAEEDALYSYWSGSDEIARLSSDLDTVQTIPVDLPAQELNSAERDTLKENASNEEHWRNLSDKLPEEKVPVNEMKIDNRNRFWLKMNYRGDTQKWLIMDEEGDPQKIVQLPKDVDLTHVSDEHLGVRLDNITFALYEPVD